MQNSADEPPSSEPSIFYPLSAWCFDYAWHNSVIAGSAPPSSRKIISYEVFARHFLEAYGNSPVADHHAKRFSKAMTYLDLHWDDFNVGNLVFLEGRTAHVNQILIDTLWVVFGNASDSALLLSPNINDVVQSALENERRSHEG